jgi:XapX domain-containing protein
MSGHTARSHRLVAPMSSSFARRPGRAWPRAGSLFLLEAPPMKPYLVSVAVGLLVGIIYSLFQVRSPAPPVIALVGLLGILVGEQLPPLVKQLWTKETDKVSWLHDHVQPHVFGKLPESIPARGGDVVAATSTPSDASARP